MDEDYDYDLEASDGELDGNILTTPKRGGEITVTASSGRREGSVSYTHLGFDGTQDLLIPLPGADGDEIRSRLAVIIGLQPQALPLGAFHGILSAIR